MSVHGLKKLDDLGSVARGKSKHRPRNDPALFGGAYPFIQTGDVKHAPLYVTEYSQTYNERGLAQSMLWDPGTLCITIAANIADTAILGIKACFPDSIIGFIPYVDKSDVRFVKYCLESYKQQLQSISRGTTQDNLSLEKLRSINFKVPKLDEQRKIAAVLTAYDDLIENNRERIALLEKMAEEIYREWFVRLRFPGHENTPIHKGVPDGWEQAKLADIAKMVFGQSPPSEFYNENGDGLPFHQGVGSYGDRYPLHIIFSSVDGRKVKAGSILFSVRAPVGRLNITDREVILGRGLAGLNEKEGRNGYLFQLLKSHFSREDLIGNGAIFASVSKKELENFPVFKPAEEQVDKFEELVTPVNQQIDNLHQSSALLARTRNLLLNRLISGKLRVDNLDIAFPPSMAAEAEPSATGTQDLPKCV